MNMRIGWKNHLRLVSRAAATWMFLMPIAGTMGRSRGVLLVAMVSLCYLTICAVADGREDNDGD